MPSNSKQIIKQITFLKYNKIIKQIVHVLCPRISILHIFHTFISMLNHPPLIMLQCFPKMVPIILHVSSNGTHSSAHISKSDIDNSALFRKRLPLKNGTSPYLRTCKGNPPPPPPPPEETAFDQAFSYFCATPAYMWYCKLEMQHNITQARKWGNKGNLTLTTKVINT